MPASTMDDSPASGDVIELEPTMDVDLAGLRAAMATVSSPALTAGPPPEPGTGAGSARRGAARSAGTGWPRPRCYWRWPTPS